MAEHSFGRANQKFTVADWRALFGAEPGIVGDVDGSAYKLTLPTGTDDAVLGSATQDSTSIVAGALHQISAGQTQTVTIPASTNAAAGRTDLIVVRYDAATYTTDPGPCRLYRVAGVEGSTALPTLDEGPPGVEDMPLWAVTRKQGQSLNQAAVRDLRRRTGPNLDIARVDVPLPEHVPLGTRVTRAGAVYRRQMNGTGPSAQPEWFEESADTVAWARMAGPGSSPALGTAESGWAANDELNGRAYTRSRDADVLLRVRRTGGALVSNSVGNFADTVIFTLKPELRPTHAYPALCEYKHANGTQWYAGHVSVEPDGKVWLRTGAPNTTLSTAPTGQAAFQSLRMRLRHTTA